MKGCFPTGSTAELRFCSHSQILLFLLTQTAFYRKKIILALTLTPFDAARLTSTSCLQTPHVDWRTPGGARMVKLLGLNQSQSSVAERVKLSGVGRGAASPTSPPPPLPPRPDLPADVEKWAGPPKREKKGNIGERAHPALIKLFTSFRTWRVKDLLVCGRVRLKKNVLKA